MIDIPSPSEVAERNRVKDEAAHIIKESEDDLWLDSWIPSAVVKLSAEYRGDPVNVLIGMIDGPTRRDGTGCKDIHYPKRFAGKCQERFMDSGWSCKYVDKKPEGICGV